MFGAPNFLVPLVMWGWIPCVLYIFATYPAQRAVIISFIGAWLFLPGATFDIPSLPDYTKMSATCYGILLATLVFDSSRFSTFKFSWLDIPMLMWCISPFISSVMNGLGPYDGFSNTLTQIVTWGLPYFLGRLYLGNLAGMRYLAIAIFVGGVIYAPLCIFEARMYRNIHAMVYGFQDYATSFLISLRYGGYRPAVFMSSGLMLGVWMMLASLMAIVLWRTKLVKQLWGMPMGLVTGVVVFTFIVVKATGAYILLVLALLCLYMAKWLRTSILLWVIAALLTAYMYMGVIGTFPGPQIVAYMSQVFSPDRVQSVEFRFQNEEMLGARARQQMLFGWGGFGRNRIFNEYGEDISITDSLWIIVYGINGVFGLTSIFAAFLLPPLAFSLRYPAKWWWKPAVTPAAALAIGIVMYTFDCVLNAMTNPVFMLACGGIAGLASKPVPKEISKA